MTTTEVMAALFDGRERMMKKYGRAPTRCNAGRRSYAHIVLAFRSLARDCGKRDFRGRVSKMTVAGMRVRLDWSLDTDTLVLRI